MTAPESRTVQTDCGTTGCSCFLSPVLDRVLQWHFQETFLGSRKWRKSQFAFIDWFTKQHHLGLCRLNCGAGPKAASHVLKGGGVVFVQMEEEAGRHQLRGANILKEKCHLDGAISHGRFIFEARGLGSPQMRRNVKYQPTQRWDSHLNQN